MYDGKGDNEPIEFDELESGTYTCTLTKVNDCERNVYRNGVKIDKKVPGLRFVFKVDDKTAWICKAVTATTSERGGLFKLLQQLHDSILRQVQFEEGYALKETFYSLIDEVKGKRFKVTCERNGEYLNFVSAVPTDDPAPASKVQTPPPHTDDDISFTDEADDEIPF